MPTYIQPAAARVRPPVPRGVIVLGLAAGCWLVVAGIGWGFLSLLAYLS